MKRSIAVLLLTGCVGMRSVGKPTELPSNLPRCSKPPDTASPQDARDDLDCQKNDAFCRETAEVARECVRTLNREVGGMGSYKGTLVLGLSTDDRGALTGVCFYGGNLGEVPDTLACLAERVAARRFTAAPNEHEQKWVVRYYIE